MKKNVLNNLIAVMFFTFAIPGGIAQASNLIANPSLETDANANNLPDGWQSNGWGTHDASFTYPVAGSSSASAAQITITSYTDGDAKWFFDDVAVVAGTTYSFKDTYKATAPTALIVRYKNTAGIFSYDFLKSVPTAALWTLTETELIPPAGTVSLTVFHVLGATGTLSVDEFDLQAVPPPTSSNLILNPELETDTNGDGTPNSWDKNSWGTNTMVFTYPVSGLTGNGAKVEMTSYTDGDAKWFFNDVAITAGESYTFSNSYKASVPTALVARYKDGAGNFTYGFLKSLPSASTWTVAEASIVPPAGTVSLTVFHIISSIGSLTIDAVSFEVATPAGGTSNLVPNPTLEADANQNSIPDGWANNFWGTNTTDFTYPTPGRNSSIGAKTEITAYTNGDAKWYFNPVAVLPNTDYVFSDYYKSNIPSRIVAVSYNASGVPTFIEVAVAPASSGTFTQATGTITTLASTTTLTVFHVIEGVGWLVIDDVNLQVSTNDPSALPNPSVETVSLNPALPESWTQQHWGTLTPTYEYLSTGGHTGNRSVKVTVSNFVDGDASWGFAPIVLTNGADYRFSVWYKTNTIPHVVARFERSDGSEYFFGMPNPEPTGTGWQEYSGVFQVPADAVKVSAFMFISNNGWLETDDYTITPYSYVGFTRGLVSFVFDDGYEENVTTAIPVLDQYGYKTTQCAATQFIEGDQNQIAKIQSLAAAGHEICSHTVTHPALTYIPLAQVDYELTHAQAFLQSITGQGITNFASPYGDYNALVNTRIALYHDSHRTTDEGYNSKDGFNKYRLKVQNMQQTTTLAEFQSWVNKANNDKTWLILVYHVVSANPTEQFDTVQSDFNAQMAWLSTNGIEVKKWNDALIELLPQLP